MELLKFCAVCVIMALSQFESSEAELRKLVAGDGEILTCEPNMLVAALLSGSSHFLRKQPGNETVFKDISVQDLVKYPETRYSMQLATVESEAIFHFNFSSLRTSDSGLWQCVKKINGIETAYKNVTFSVKPAEDVGNVELKLTNVASGKEVKLMHEDGAADPTSSSATILSGEYVLTCMAEKGYPEPEYTLFRNGQRIGSGTSVTVNLTTSDTNMGCNVMVNRKKFHEHSMYFELTVQDVKPEIKCMTTSARVTDVKAVMNCTVVAADVTCTKVEWKSGTTNDSFKHNGKKVMGYDLRCQSNGKNSVWSSLEVRNLEEKHFDDTYFIQIRDSQNGDFQKQEPIQILRKPGALNGSAQMVPLGSLTLVAVVTLLKIFL